jgi:hypothetical protein
VGGATGGYTIGIWCSGRALRRTGRGRQGGSCQESSRRGQTNTTRRTLTNAIICMCHRCQHSDVREAEVLVLVLLLLTKAIICMCHRRREGSSCGGGNTYMIHITDCTHITSFYSYFICTSQTTGGEPMWGRQRGEIKHGSMRGSFYDYSGRDKWPFARPVSDHWKYARRRAERAAVQVR